MAKGTDEEKTARKNAIELSSQYASEVPYKVMQTAMMARALLRAMLEIGNPASVTDAGVGALCCLTAVEGAYMNVRINTKDLSCRSPLYGPLIAIHCSRLHVAVSTSICRV